MTITKNRNSRLDQMTADQTLATGITLLAKQIGTLIIGGQPYKAADIVKVLQTRIAVQQPIAPARANVRKLVASGNAELLSTHDLILTVRQLLQVMFSNDPTMLTALGLTARKVGEKTPAVKVAAAAKAKVTRAAGGKKAVKAAEARAAALATKPQT